jgi:hypothetical protein
MRICLVDAYGIYPNNAWEVGISELFEGGVEIRRNNEVVVAYEYSSRWIYVSPHEDKASYECRDLRDAARLYSRSSVLISASSVSAGRMRSKRILLSLSDRGEY